jgi:hypothetical protein
MMKIIWYETGFEMSEECLTFSLNKTIDARDPNYGDIFVHFNIKPNI